MLRFGDVFPAERLVGVFPGELLVGVLLRRIILPFAPLMSLVSLSVNLANFKEVR